MSKNKKNSKGNHKKHISCPRCKWDWTAQEIEAQECDICNYPHSKNPSISDLLDNLGVTEDMEFDENL